MNRQSSKSATINCDKCAVEVSRQKAFFQYNFQCCSTKCLDHMRTDILEKQRKDEEERESKRPRHGAFTLSSGGGYAH
ncbi:Hypothetical protein HVR_LOCUS172 [uncultured virus]|nr:Hypothetical protein HVR_LOCUS172 [uncultured virus]